MQRRIKLIGLDLDGTVFNHKKQITKETREAITEAVSKGIFVVPVTGRPFTGLMRADGFFGISGVNYAVCSNGAAIYDLQNGNCIGRDCMSVEKTLEVLKCIDAFPLVPDCFIEGKGHIRLADREKIRELPMTGVLQNYILGTRNFVENLSTFVEENRCEVEKITINFFSEGRGRRLLCLDEVQERLDRLSGITVVSGAPHNREVNKEGVSKGSGLLTLGGLLGISTEEMMACGDSENDKSMIEVAGLGVAMGNAQPEIKKLADYVTLSNEEDGVAHAIRELVL